MEIVGMGRHAEVLRLIMYNNAGLTAFTVSPVKTGKKQ